MIEAISKILGAAAKHAWGGFVVCLFVILLPSQPAKSIGLDKLKADYLGFWWLGLMFFAAVWGGSVFSRVPGWIATSRERQRERRQLQKSKERIIKRLYSLDASERAWIAYCLLKNVQTLSATEIDRTANSLVNKGIIDRGSGSVLNLPYHIRDFVWECLQDKRDEFLPPDVRNNPEKVRALERFARSLKELR